MVGAPGTTGALGWVRAALLLSGQHFASRPVTGILDTSLEAVLWIGCPIGRPGSAELPLPVGSPGGWGSSSSSAFLAASPRVTVITAEKCHPDLGPQGATRPGGVSSRFWGSETLGVSLARAIVFRWVPGQLEPSARSAECILSYCVTPLEVTRVFIPGTTRSGSFPDFCPNGSFHHLWSQSHYPTWNSGDSSAQPALSLLAPSL